MQHSDTVRSVERDTLDLKKRILAKLMQVGDSATLCLIDRLLDDARVGATLSAEECAERARRSN